jgi:hypothetical protein
MTVRRVAGVFTALFMLHLSLVAGDAACATHMAGHSEMAAGHTASDAAAPGMRMNAKMATQGEHGRRQHEHRCDAPVQANCCQSLASCGSIFTANDAASHAPLLQRNIFPRSAIGVPESELIAPDTPPPKA